LQPPATGPIRVAFLLSDGAVVIDFAGPWEVFDNVAMPRNRQENAFQLYTVAATLAPVKVSGGMTIVPACTFATAPPPHVIVIPAQGGASAEALDWIRQASASADLTMSVCNGAFVLAKTGLLAGKSATAYHTSYGQFAMQFPDVKLVRGMRFVESGNLPARADCHLVSTWRCTWWNAISAARPRARPHTPSNTRGVAGWIRGRTRSMPRAAAAPRSTRCARSATWTSPSQQRQRPRIAASAIIFAAMNTRRRSIPARRNLPDGPAYAVTRP
jgi:putative intracellular protease/amidase